MLWFDEMQVSQIERYWLDMTSLQSAWFLHNICILNDYILKATDYTKQVQLEIADNAISL